MLKVQTGQIVEFYSNSCCVVSEGKELRCKIQGRINLVVGDLVQLELSSMDGNSEGLVTKRLDRVTVLYKSKEKIKKPIAIGFLIFSFDLYRTVTLSNLFVTNPSELPSIEDNSS